MVSRINELASRVQSDPFFLASALADYARSEGLDERGLARRLGCPLETLGPLGLCRRPRPEPVLFRQDTGRITSRFGVKAEVLAEVVRRSNALSVMQRGAKSERGLLMAARDRKDSGRSSDETRGKTS